MKLEIHKVYTEVVNIEAVGPFNGVLACENINHLQAGRAKNVMLTLDDEKVTCKDCLLVIWNLTE